MDEQIQKELQELQNLENSGSLDDTQQSRLTVLNMLNEAEKTAQQKSKDLESALAQKEHFRTKLEEQLKTSGQGQKPPVQEGRELERAKLREMMTELEVEKEAEEKKALEELNSKISELKIIDPALDEKALLDIIEKYGVDADNAFKIYNDLKQGQVPKITPKIPTGTKTSDEVKEEIFQPKTKGSLWEAASEGLKKFGLK